MTANPKPDAVTADQLRKLADLARPCDCDHGCSHDSAYAEIDNMGGWKAIAMGLLDEADKLRAELATADDRAKDAHAVGFAAGIEAAIASIMKHSNIARRRMAECYDELDPDGYNGWGDIVSHLDIELGAIRALTPPDVTAAAARVLLADDVALSKMAEAVHDGPLGADEYWFSAATPQGGWCVDVVRAALRAIAKGEKL